MFSNSQATRTLNRFSLLLVFLVSAFLHGGCSRRPPSFELRPEAKKLIPPAREALTKVLDQGFGKPGDLVAWLALPVRYGWVEGEVTDVLDARARTLRVRLQSAELPQENAEAASLHGLGVFWLGPRQVDGQPTQDGDGSFSPWHVNGFDVANQTLTLDGPPKPAPKPGDRFALVGHVLQQGYVVFMDNCATCHGTSGAGDGPKAPGMNPKPRDYRLGIFKFTSTKPGIKPSRSDLQRTVRRGIPGTYMPSFESTLSAEQIAAVVEYVRWLSIRGELERRLVDQLALDYSEQAVQEEAQVASMDTLLQDLDTFLREDFYPAIVPETVSAIAQAWVEADDPANLVVPRRPPDQTLNELVAWLTQNRDKLNDLVRWWKQASEAVKSGKPVDSPYPERLVRLLRNGTDAEALAAAARQSEQSLRQFLREQSIQHGRELYMSDLVKCYSCHGETGRGDGPQTKERQLIPGKNEFYPEPGLHDDWGNKIHPNDLTRGIFRAGKEPIDVYRRIYSGIKGTPMAAFATSLTDDDDIWDLVQFVLSLSKKKRFAKRREATPSADNPA